MPCIFSPTARQTADGANGHVVIADDLAGQPDAGQPARVQHVLFRGRHRGRLAVDELDSTRGTARIAAARVELVDLGVLFEGEDETLTRFDVHRRMTFYRQFWHLAII